MTRAPRRINARLVLAALALVLAHAALALALPPRAAWAQKELPVECAAPLDDDPATLKVRAREHYDRATLLYDEGQYEAAITEFTAVYCLINLDSAAYSIALSYVNLVDYERAVDWFELFVRLTADVGKRKAAANRIDRIRKLPARVSVSTQPPQAHVTLTSDAGTISGRADDKEPIRAPAGAYTLQIDMDGYEPISQAIELRIGQPYTYSFRLTDEQGPVRVTTNPLSARIFVDDKLVAVGTYVANLPVGTHKVTVEAEGRNPVSQPIEVEAGDTVNLFVTLPPPLTSGRWELISAMTVFGAAAGGSLGSTVFAQDSTGGSFITVGAAAIAFAGGYFGVKETIPVGHTSWLIGGTAWGVAQGAGLAAIFAPGDTDVLTSSAFAGLIVGAVASSLTVKRFDPSAGDSAFINSGGLWGGVGGMMLWALFDEGEDDNERRFAAFSLIGMNTGLLAGAALAYRYEYSRGHLALIDVSGLAGAVTGLALSSSLAADTADENDTSLHYAFGGMLLGLVSGAVLTRNLDVDKIPAALSASVPRLGLARTLAGDTLPLLEWSGRW